MFKEASKKKLRFATSKGELSVENLWDLSQTALATIVRALKKKLVNDDDNELSFLDDTSSSIKSDDQLRFDIAKAVYLDKKAENDELKNKAAKKQQRQDLLEALQKSQNKALEQKSPEEIQKMIDELED